MIWKVAAIVWLIIEVVLSHTPGDRSGHQSEALASWTHLPERTLRRAAHVALFALLGLFAGMGFEIWGVGAVALWAVVDEVTKPFIPGRHCSVLDIFLNLGGCAAGLALWLLVR